MPVASETYINGEPISEDQAPTQEDKPTVVEEAPPEAKKESELDDIEKQIANREWRVVGEYTVRLRTGGDEVRNFDKTYIQKPLSFTSMLQFTGLIGETIADAMSGPDGVTINGMLAEGQGVFAAGGLLTQQDFSGVDAFVKGLAKLASFVPSVVDDCQCIWLRVPLHERQIVKEIWSRSPEDGGLTPAEGQQMLELFIDQNYQEVEDFFTVRLRQLIEKVSRLRTKRGSKSGGSLLSRLSKPIAGPTPSQ